MGLGGHSWGHSGERRQLPGLQGWGDGEKWAARENLTKAGSNLVMEEEASGVAGTCHLGPVQLGDSAGEVRWGQVW